MSNDEKLAEVHALMVVMCNDMKDVKRDVRLILDGDAAVCKRHDKEISGLKKAMITLVVVGGGGAAGAGLPKILALLLP